MKNKIALEEHFSIPELAEDSRIYFKPEVWTEFKQRVLDLQTLRIADMDQCGIETAILSQNSPAIQAIPEKKRAIEFAKKSNDFLAEQIEKNPKRFRGFAALPMQDPDAAILELTRCVKEYGFKGALVNGYSEVEGVDGAVYYDLPQYRPFWQTMETLDVPFYLHPREPYPNQRRIYDGCPWLLGSAWAFGVETATHALRLMSSGLFDKFPKLTIILGHLGETLPYAIWRTDHRIAFTPRDITTKKTLSEYFRSNFYITTSGDFRTQALLNAMLEIGVDRVLFSTDYPFEKMSWASEWFDVCSISENDRLKIGRANAAKLFKL